MPGGVAGGCDDALDKDSPEQLSMRTLAQQLGLRASSLYHHYPDRASLEAAIASHAATQLHQAMLDAASQAESETGLAEAATAYVTFAREHPHLYAVLHAPRPPALGTAGTGKDLWNFVLSLVARVTGNADDTSSAVALWSFLHGYASLERSGLFGLSGPQGALEQGLRALLTGMKKAP